MKVFAIPLTWIAKSSRSLPEAIDSASLAARKVCIGQSVVNDWHNGRQRFWNTKLKLAKKAREATTMTLHSACG